jgi:hypothetical protein
MPEYTLSQTDLNDATLFLEQFMTESVPEASFRVGSATRDFLVKGFAYLYAYLRGEIDRGTARQSLLRIQEELTDEDDISQAVDELLSNLFISRKGGDYVRMSVRLHFEQKRAQSISSSSRFWRTNSLIFYLDTPADNYVISEGQMLPVFGSNGVLIDYVVDVPMRAARTGTAYQVEPGTFVRVQVPGGLPYFSYAEDTEATDNGKEVESSSELIARAETALSTRNLINNRSCDSTLQQFFPAITETLTVGMGEAEQIRDRRFEIGSHLDLRIGGHYDTYIGLPLTTVEENLTVGGYAVRPDGIVNIFRDPELTYDLGRTFKTFFGIQPGHNIYIRSGIESSPRAYLIVNVTDHEIQVRESSPFTEASDEFGDLPNAVIYSVGWFSPDFSEVELEPGIHQRTAAPSTNPTYEAVPYGTSRRISESGKVVLSGKPVQDIDLVEVTDPDGGDILIDPTTNTVLFNNRVNTTPAHTVEPSFTQYQMVTYNYALAQSMWAVNAIRVGYPAVPPSPAKSYDGKNLRVVYKTLSGFSDVHAYTAGRDVRVAAANHLVKAKHPVWVQVHIQYRLKDTATGTLDADAASQAIANHINNFESNDTLDVSDISQAFRDAYSIIGAVYPLTAYYYLNAPDGQQAFFSTTDIISIFSSGTNGVVLENGGDITPPTEMQRRGVIVIGTSQELADYFSIMGVSDRTVIYRSMKSMITFEQKG